MIRSLATATTAIFFSLVLGAIALVFVAIQFPEQMQHIQSGAGWVETQIETNIGIQPRYAVWVDFFLEKRQLVFMAFVIVSRMLLYLLINGTTRLIFGPR
jgi:hypothetical protein